MKRTSWVVIVILGMVALLLLVFAALPQHYAAKALPLSTGTVAVVTVGVTYISVPTLIITFVLKDRSVSEDTSEGT